MFNENLRRSLSIQQMARDRMSQRKQPDPINNVRPLRGTGEGEAWTRGDEAKFLMQQRTLNHEQRRAKQLQGSGQEDVFKKNARLREQAERNRKDDFILDNAKAGDGWSIGEVFGRTFPHIEKNHALMSSAVNRVDELVAAGHPNDLSLYRRVGREIEDHYFPTSGPPTLEEQDALSRAQGIAELRVMRLANQAELRQDLQVRRVRELEGADPALPPFRPGGGEADLDKIAEDLLYGEAEDVREAVQKINPHLANSPDLDKITEAIQYGEPEEIKKAVKTMMGRR